MDQPPRPARPRSPPLRPQLIQLMATLLFLFLAYEGAIWYWNVTSPRQVSVPKIVGLKEGEAVNVLTGTDLKPEIVARKYDEQIAGGDHHGGGPQARTAL